MKFFKKTTLSAALLAASVMGVSQQASANLDVDPGIAAAGDPYVSNNHLGQVLIFPYYTVRGGKKSVINVFNTSDRTVAVKVRFHESHNSRDVLDFNLVLSPFDKWAGTVSEGGNGGAIFKSTDNSCTINQEEVFGPFATFLEFDTLEEAIAIANDSEFGLVSYLWSNDLAAVTKAIREIRVGTIWVNTTLVGDPRAPFGGVKGSGTGREGGVGSVEFYTELKSVVIPTGGPAPVSKLGLKHEN